MRPHGFRSLLVGIVDYSNNFELVGNQHEINQLWGKAFARLMRLKKVDKRCINFPRLLFELSPEGPGSSK